MGINRHLHIIAVLILGCFLAGCAKKPSSDDKILARAGNDFITLSEFKTRIARMPSYFQDAVSKNKKRYLDEMIAEKLFYEEALRKGVNRDKEVAEILNEAKKKIVIAKFIKQEVEDKAVVREEDIKKFYGEHKDEFKTPEMWRASHILVATEAEAKGILDALAAGAKFEDLAKQKSMDVTASRGGDIGYFRVGQLVPEFEKACIKLNVGQLSDIVKTKFGYHIIKLTDKKAQGAESYENARTAVENELKKAKRRVLFDELLARLKAKYGIEIHEEVMKTLEPQVQEAGK
jgi:peptidyl-prolyl cis-trans isomerase C